MAEEKNGQPADASETDPAEVAEDAGEPGLQDPLVAARAAAEQYKDQALRALAEAENTRRRFQREREDLHRYAIGDFVKEMLPVVDNLRRALEAIPPDARAADQFLESLAAGVEMTERQLLAAFDRFHVKKVEPKPGEPLDAHRHQAMFEVPDSGQPTGTVAQVMQPGYLLHDRLLR
ncbi:MAG TPA: nucleotide exchange factor GrpE, partial [Candidatus Limnocylindrales bacterium]